MPKTDDEIDPKETYQKLITFINGLSIQDIAIIALLMLIFAMYALHQKDIAACNAYWINKTLNSSRFIFI